jgi:hypothetical protein
MKKKNIISIILLLGCLNFLTGCVTTKGVYDTSLTSKEPYVFEYEGSTDEIITIIKRALIKESFLFPYCDDRKDGMLNTDFKILDQDEYFNVHFMANLLGVNVGIQRGRLSFIFTDLGNDKTEIELYAIISVEVKKDSWIDGFEGLTTQGHPFIMKYKEIIRNIDKMELIYEPMPEITKSSANIVEPSVETSYTPIIFGVSVALLLVLILSQ